MTVNDVFLLMNYAIDKNQNGTLPDDDFNRIINVGQRSYISFLLGTFQQYQPGRPIARVELGQNMTVRQRLTPAIYGYILNVNSNGNSPYPLDYLQVDAMTSIYGFKRIKAVQQDSVYSYYNSTIDPIATNPIYLIKDEGFQFYPENLGQARMSYVRNPPDIKWGYSVDANGRHIYSPNDSVDPIWDDVAILEIIVRSLSIVGVNLQLPVVQQYANDIKNNGQ